MNAWGGAVSMNPLHRNDFGHATISHGLQQPQTGAQQLP